jgi:hypothetical protein
LPVNESQRTGYCIPSETDNQWKNGLKKATDKYAYKIEVPLDNTYGLLFYSS